MTPGKVKMTFTWDESFILVRALERSITLMESYIPDAIDPAFWSGLIALDKQLLEKIEKYRVDSMGCSFSKKGR